MRPGLGILQQPAAGLRLGGVVERAGRFRNELVLATHFSTRYHDRQIQHHLKRALPNLLDGRLQWWL